MGDISLGAVFRERELSGIRYLINECFTAQTDKIDVNLLYSTPLNSNAPTTSTGRDNGFPSIAPANRYIAGDQSTIFE